MYSHSHGILQEYINQGHKKSEIYIYVKRCTYIYIYCLRMYQEVVVSTCTNVSFFNIHCAQKQPAVRSL